MLPFFNPAAKTHPLVAITFLWFFAISGQPIARAGELEWSNAAGAYPNMWMTGTAENWANGSTGTHFTAGNAVVFGASGQTAQPGTITITSSNGVTLGASGTNPGMIVTGTGNWEFVLAHTTSTISGTTTTTGTSNAGIGIAGSGAGVLMEGTGTLTFSTTTSYTGTTEVRAGTLRLNVADAIAQSPVVTLASSAKLDLGSHNQSLMALNVSPGANVVFSSTGANYTKLTLGTLTGDGGVFKLRTNLGGENSDQIDITGTGEGAHTLEFDHGDTVTEKADTSILVVAAPSGAGATFSGTTDGPIYQYQVERGANGNWYLNNTTQLSRITSAVISSAAAAGQDWHYQLDALYLRMGELREPPQGGTASLWFRAHASRLNADSSLTGYDFHQYSHGGTAGADKAFHPGGSTLFVGAFGVMDRVDRDFGVGGDGKTKSTGGGLYVTWLHEAGWHADLIGRVDSNKNNINAVTVDGHLATADYDNKVKGFSFELGRRLLWNDEWWLEPSVQYALANIGGANYRSFSESQPPVDVAVRKARASQARVSLRIGETGGSNPGWHPYAKVAFAYSSTRDGQVRVGGGADAREFTADFDGWRWEAGFGAAYVINARSQVYYDYEYASATRYNRPWSVNLGYRFAW